jgi:chitinase
MSPELLQALKSASSQCLPVQKSTRWKDKNTGEEKSMSSLKDYQESSNVAMRANGIAITFDEDKETMELTTNVSLLSTGERRSIKTTVKPANKPDPEQAKTFGFMNAKGKMLVNLLELV